MKVLSRVFRGMVVEDLRHAYDHSEIDLCRLKSQHRIVRLRIARSLNPASAAARALTADSARAVHLKERDSSVHPRLRTIGFLQVSYRRCLIISIGSSSDNTRRHTFDER